MRLSDLLDLPVVDSAGSHIGTVIDIRLCVPGEMGDRPGTPTLFGIIVSPHTRSSYLGYERRRVDQPRVLAALLRWRHRGTFLTLWCDIADISGGQIQLTREATRYSPALTGT